MHGTKDKQNRMKTVEYPCNLSSYHGLHPNDLRRHQNTMHGVPFTCGKCNHEVISLSALSMHILEKHRVSRTFHSTQNAAAGTAHHTPPSQYAARSSASAKFQCQLPCNSSKKIFDYQDELELHTWFHHGTHGRTQAQN